MIVEFLRHRPFVRKHTCAIVGHTSHHSMHGTPHDAHHSWVRTVHGLGWIHHHEAGGYVIEFSDGRLLKTPIVEHVEAPK